MPNEARERHGSRMLPCPSAATDCRAPSGTLGSYPSAFRKKLRTGTAQAAHDSRALGAAAFLACDAGNLPSAAGGFRGGAAARQAQGMEDSAPSADHAGLVDAPPMTRRSKINLIWEHPKPSPDHFTRPLPYLIDCPSKMASSGKFLRFRDRTLVPLMQTHPDDPDLAKLLECVEAVLAWRATIPLCQTSCRLNRIGTFGGADSRTWLDTDKRTKIG
ncbi:MAG: hypothetical protein AB7P20_06290 [Rhizobiaceae bacterium]